MLIALTFFSTITLLPNNQVVAQEIIKPVSQEQITLGKESLEPDELSGLETPVVQDKIIEPVEEVGQPNEMEPPELTVANDGNVRVVKIQLKDASWLCADYAEFFVLEKVKIASFSKRKTRFGPFFHYS